jgi:hypothetical protein
MYQLLVRSSGLYSVNEVVNAINKIPVPQNQKRRSLYSFVLKFKNVWKAAINGMKR